MKITQCISFVSVAMFCACLISVDDLTAEEPITDASIAQAVAKTEAEEAPKTIRWSFLAPENGKPFNDPFAKLTQNQLSDLSFVVRVQRLIAEEKIKADGIDAKEAAEVARKLTNEGIDIGWIMVQRQRVQQIRRLQIGTLSMSIAESLGNKRVTLTGFVMPVKMSQQRLVEFFLVPTTAICSNEAAPSPLQVVFVSTEQGIERPKKGIPVRVTGRVKAQTTSKTTSFGIGVTTVQSAYTMLSPEIEVFPRTVK